MCQFIFLWLVKNEQFEAYKTMKQLTTEENSNVAMFQMNFAENFICLYQDKVVVCSNVFYITDISIFINTAFNTLVYIYVITFL